MGDIIINYDMSKEGEVVIKKGSKPTMIKKFNEYGIDDVVDDLGKDVLNFLPLTKEEVNNGFTYMDGLKEKDMIYLKNITEMKVDNGIKLMELEQSDL